MPYIKKKEADILRIQIITSYNNNEDWKPLAIASNIATSTAYRWISTQFEPRKLRGGNRKKIIKDHHLRYIKDRIEENPKITLK